MASENAKRDENRVVTLLGVTDDSAAEIRRLLIDPATGRLKVSATVSVALNDLSDVNLTSEAQGDVLYRNASEWVNLAPGSAGEVLTTGGAAANPSWSSAGAGNVIKVGTPVDNQVGVWTGDGTIEGTAGLTYDGSNFQLTGDIGSTGTRITKGWFTDLQVTNAIAASITGNSATVSTITGLAPDTATTQATQPNITTCANLVTVGTVTTGNVDAVVTDAAADGATKGKAAFTATDFDAASGVISLDYTNGQKASTTQAGFLTELATSAETDTGTDAARAVSPDGFAGSNYGKRVVEFIIIEGATDTAVGDKAGNSTFRVPVEMNGWNLVDVEAHVETAGTTGTTDIQIRNVTQTADMLSTKITIDSGETDSSTAATPPVIDAANDDVATGDKIAIDIDAISTTAAKGLTVTMSFRLP